ncbi:MAG: glycosyltransferase [Candidatus Komeilibacteria bacterium]|nr:glycosyltransferase [Candidatus Komeilibacteria bacterium]
MGTFFLIRQSVIKKIGQLNENFFTWFEEVEYCRRVRKANFVIWYQADAAIIHYGGQSFGQISNLNRQLIYNKSLLGYWLLTKNYFGVILTLLLWLPSLAAQAIIQLLRLKKHAYQPF